MKRFFLFCTIFTISLTSCDILDHMGEIKRFAECNFTVQGAEVVSLGRVDVRGYDSPSDFNLSDMIVLGQSMLSGKLDTKMKVNILARNNNSSKAAISGMKWQLYMKNGLYGSGEIVEYVEVLPNNSTVFPVQVEFDLLKIINSDNIKSIINLVSDLDNADNLKNLDIMLKIKPKYSTSGGVKEYPGYLTIRP